ncbi:hypothetical protein F0562_004400 [Nyssa sinensis]|uniref:CASP-like protein n=1 Tax=Nyssa sinensis TaxID=561372 RepID=A0A5J5C331_9ASTE|nr:hypothetical protein F0562_004400 [Nyssa sinensis]
MKPHILTQEFFLVTAGTWRLIWRFVRWSRNPLFEARRVKVYQEPKPIPNIAFETQDSSQIQKQRASNESYLPSNDSDDDDGNDIGDDGHNNDNCRFFVVANSIVSAYLVLSLALTIFHIVRSGTQGSRIILIFFDPAMLGLLTAGASTAAAMVYLAHKGSARANWIAICQQFNSFCDRISGSLIGSFGGIILVFML